MSSLEANKYPEWRRIQREALKEDVLPGMSMLSEGLFAYRRRASQRQGDRALDLADEASIQLDLDIDQARVLVEMVRLWNPRAALSDVYLEHYSDRTAALQVILEAIKRGLGDPDELYKVALNTLADLLEVPPSQRIAGHTKPSGQDLTREWAIQRVKEEYLILQCLGRARQPSENKSELRHLLHECCAQSRSKVHEQMLSVQMRQKERLYIDRTWVCIIILDLISNRGTEPEMDVTAFARSSFLAVIKSCKRSATVDEIIDAIQSLIELFGSDIIPESEEWEREALRLFLEITLPELSVSELNDSVTEAVDLLCGLAFGPESQNACTRFWDPASPYAFLDYVTKADKCFYIFLAHSGFSKDAFSALTAYLEDNSVVERELKGFMHACTVETRVTPQWLRSAITKARFDLSRVLYDNLSEFDAEMVARAHLRIILRLGMTSTTTESRALAASLQVVSGLCRKMSLIRQMVAEAVTAGKSGVTSDIKNVIISCVLGNNVKLPPHNVLSQLLELCLALESEFLKSSDDGAQLKRDMCVVVSRVLRQHRRIGRFDLQAMGETFDVDTSVRALRLAAKVRHLDPDDAEIVLALLTTSSSERLTRESQSCLESVPPLLWVRPFTSFHVLHAFRIAPETSARLLERLVNSPGHPGALGMLSVDAFWVAKEQLFQCLQSGDGSAYAYLAREIETEPDRALSLLCKSEEGQLLPDPELARLLVQQLLSPPELASGRPTRRNAGPGTNASTAESENRQVCYLYSLKIVLLLVQSPRSRSAFFRLLQNENLSDHFSQGISRGLRFNMSTLASCLRIITHTLDSIDVKVDGEVLKDAVWETIPKPQKGTEDAAIEFCLAWIPLVSRLDTQLIMPTETEQPVVVDFLRQAFAWMAHVLERKGNPKLATAVSELISTFLVALGDAPFLPWRDILEYSRCYIVDTMKVFGNGDSLANLCTSFGWAVSKCDQAELSEFLQQMLPTACDYLLMTSPPSGDKLEEYRAALWPALTLFGVCCSALAVGDDVDFNLLKEALNVCVEILKRSELDDLDKEQRLVVLILRKAAVSHPSILAQLGLMQSLAQCPRLPLMDTLELALTLRRTDEAGCRNVMRVREKDMSSSLRAYKREGYGVFRLSKLREATVCVRAIRLLGLKGLFFDCWQLVRDIIEFGDSNSTKSSFLEQFAEQCVRDLKGDESYELTSRLVVYSLAVETEELELMEQPPALPITSIDSVSSPRTMQSPGLHSALIAQDSPVQSPLRMNSNVNSSPRSVNGALVPVSHSTPTSSAYPPRKRERTHQRVTRFHVEVERHIEYLLVELFMLLTDPLLVDYKTTPVFPLDLFTHNARLHDRPSDRPDTTTLLCALRWLSKTPSYSLDKGIWSRLVALICIALGLAVRSMPLDARDESHKSALDDLKRKLFPDKDKKEKRDTFFSGLIRRISRFSDCKESADIVEEVAATIAATLARMGESSSVPKPGSIRVGGLAKS